VTPAGGGTLGEDGSTVTYTEAPPLDRAVDQRSLRYMLKVYGGFRGGSLKILVSSFLSAIGGGMSWFVLILYINELFPQLGNTGLVFSISGWTATFVLIPGGVLVDRYDHRTTLAFALMLGAVSMAMFSIAETLLVIFAAQILNGASMAINRPAYQALMTEKTSDVRRKYLFSMQSFVSMLGVAVASTMAGGWTLAARAWFDMDLLSAYRIMFLVAALAQTVAVTISITIRPGEEDREQEDERLTSPVDETEDPSVARKRSLRFIAKFSTPMALIGFGAGFVVPFFQIYYLLKFDVDVSQVAWLFAATQLAMGLSFFLVPNLAERRGSVGAVVVTQGIAIANLAAIPFAPMFIIAAPFHLFRMALMNASTPIQNSLMMGAVRPEDRGKATAIAQVAFTATNSIGITFTGFIMERNLDAPFAIAVSFYCVALVLFWYWFRKVGEM
jgi:MFS family permease